MENPQYTPETSRQMMNDFLKFSRKQKWKTLGTNSNSSNTHTR